LYVAYSNEYAQHIQIITWSQLPFIPKVIDCMHQMIESYLERERSIVLLSVTNTLYAYQVCHGVGRCVKDGSCSSSSLE